MLTIYLSKVAIKLKDRLICTNYAFK